MNLQHFHFYIDQVRIIVIDGEPWFIASDIAKILGYRDAANMVRNLDDSEKGTHIVSTLGGDQEMAIISESGVYHAILKSRRAEAVAFRKWVTGDLLPRLARDGAYTMGGHALKGLSPTAIFNRHERALNGLARAKSDAARRSHYEIYAACCRAMGFKVEPIEGFGLPPSKDMSQMRAIWEVMRPLVNDGIVVNHSRNWEAGELAISIAAAELILHKHGIRHTPGRLRALLKLSDNPRFVGIKTVNSVEDRSVHCWVFLDGAAEKPATPSDQLTLTFDTTH